MAVESFRQDSRHGGLAHAARPGEQERMSRTSITDGGMKHTSDVRLSDDLAKRARTEAVSENGVSSHVQESISRLDVKEVLRRNLRDQTPPADSERVPSK